MYTCLRKRERLDLSCNGIQESGGYHALYFGFSLSNQPLPFEWIKHPLY